MPALSAFVNRVFTAIAVSNALNPLQRRTTQSGCMGLSTFRFRRQDETQPPKSECVAVQGSVALPQQQVSAAASYESRIDAIRESIDLLEADLAAMIRDVHQTSGVVRHGVQACSEALAIIRERSEDLASQDS